MTQKYHAAIGFPDRGDLLLGRIDIDPSAHAERRAHRHKYGPFDLPDAIYISREMYECDPFDAAGPEETTPHVFKMEVEGGSLQKVNVRYEYDDTYDQVAVVAADGTLVTSWLNYRHDTHETLDRSQYVKP